MLRTTILLREHQQLELTDTPESKESDTDQQNENIETDHQKNSDLVEESVSEQSYKDDNSEKADSEEGVLIAEEDENAAHC